MGLPTGPARGSRAPARHGAVERSHASSKLTAEEVDACDALFYFMREHVEWIAGCVGEAPVRRALESGRLCIVPPGRHPGPVLRRR